MDEQEITHRYFRRPHQFSNFLLEPRRCDLCGVIRHVYRMVLHGDPEATKGIRHVCDQCLSSGVLVERNLELNEGNIGALREQLSALHPDYSAEGIEVIARPLSVEVNQRTPHPSTWQHFFWPAHCGDYCRYEREAGKPDLLALAGDRDVITFIEDCLQENDRSMTDTHDLWESLRPDSPKGITPAYDIGVYLFQCLTCDQYILLWDAS